MSPEAALPPDGPAVRVPRRRAAGTVLGIAAAIVLVVGAVVLIGRGTGGSAPKTVLPQTVGGLERRDEAVDLTQVRGELHGDGQAGAYGRAGLTRADVIVVVAGDRRAGSPEDKLDRFYTELRESQAVVDTAATVRQDAGPGAALLQCHPVTYPRQELTVQMCVWADEHTVGSVIAVAGADNVDAVDELADVARQMRGQVDGPR